jgi:rhodanese-related sulfurtransferase
MIRSLNPKDFSSEIVKPNSILVDIRTKEEFDSGRIANSINIDYYNPEYLEEFKKLDKASTINIYCASGGRSSSAVKEINKLGFENINELDGGVYSWYLQKLPLVNQ